MIQAQSLARVVERADNPPLEYGRCPQPQCDALTLYIARVPGSRDIFLTTIKPLGKVVRAEDVQSCLYYVHVDSERDVELLREDEQRLFFEHEDEIHTLAEEKSGVPVIQRKPLPAKPGLFQQPELPPRTFPHYHLPCPKPRAAEPFTRKPVDPEGPHSAPTGPTRKLQGPRQMVGRPASTIANERQPHSTTQENNKFRKLFPQAPIAVTNAAFPHKQQDLDRSYEANIAIKDMSPKPRPRDSFTSQTSDGKDYPPDQSLSDTISRPLTLIRRYDSLQSNVCRIDAEGSLEMCSPNYHERTKHVKMIGNGQNLGSEMAEHGGRLFRTSLHARQETDSARPSSKLASSERSLMIPPKRDKLGMRRHNPPLADMMNTYGRNHASEKRPSMKHYTFGTPWRSTCEFAIGIAGRSFKCKHTPPTGTDPATLSELRFNLPSSQALRSPPKLAITERDSWRKSLFQLHRQSGSEVSQENRHYSSAAVPESYDEERMDLSLGQEHAGGGFGGKQAKLGKLIIEPDGFQMLDLLVAANIAMWWKIYDRFV